MKKLEFKDIAPSLAFEPRFKLSDIGRFNLDEEYPSGYANSTLKITNIILDGDNSEFELSTINGNWSVGFVGLDEIMPILRPLSDLVKEIEVEGEKFVPGEELSNLIDEYNMGYNDHYFDYEKGMYVITDVEKQPYFIVQQLIEWHFDINNLIGQGLAIDINTLED